MLDEIIDSQGYPDRLTAPAGLARARALVATAHDDARARLVDLLKGAVGRVEARPDAIGALAALRAAAAVGDPVQLLVVDRDPGGMTQSQLVAAVRGDPRLAGIGVLNVTTPFDQAAFLEAAACILEPRPHRILVVEDDLVNQKVAVAYLEQMGCRVDVASDGPSALDAMGRRAYAAVLMDCQIPLLDGYQTTAEIRRREGDGRHTPIVAMTSSDTESDRQRCLSAGMDDHVAKPLRRPALAALLEHWVAPSVTAAPEPSASGPADGRVDEDTLSELLELDPQASILPVFLTEASRSIEQARQALSGERQADAARIAHTLRGSAGTFGAPRVARLSAEMELACGRDFEQAAALLDLIEAEFDAFRDIISSRLPHAAP